MNRFLSRLGGIFRGDDRVTRMTNEALLTVWRLEELEEHYGAVTLRRPEPREGYRATVEVVVPLADGRERHAGGETLAAAVEHAYMAHQLVALRQSAAVIKELAARENLVEDVSFADDLPWGAGR